MSVNFQDGAEQVREVRGALDAAAQFEEHPAVAARHVLHFHAAERREIKHERVEHRRRKDQRQPAGTWPCVGLQAVEDAPGVGGKAVADGEGGEMNPTQQIAHAEMPVFLVKDGEHFLLQRIPRARRLVRHLQHVEPRQHLAKRADAFQAAGGGVIGQATDRATRGAHHVLQAFRVAAEPEEVVGRAAREIRGRALQRRRNRGNRSRRLIHVVGFRQHPDVLAQAAQ